MTVTQAQRDLLAWLAREGLLDGDGLRGGTLVDYYAERHQAQLVAEYRTRGQEPPAWSGRYTAGSGRVHAWRRTGGRLLGNMHRAGLLVWVRTSWGTPEYRLTDAAKALARGEAG